MKNRRRLEGLWYPVKQEGRSPAVLVYYFIDGSDGLNGLGPCWVSALLNEGLQGGIDAP